MAETPDSSLTHNRRAEYPLLAQTGKGKPANPGTSQYQSDRHKVSPADAWGEPVDIFADESSVTPTLEPRHVPDVVWRFAVDTAERMGVDPAAVALAALVSCSSVISDAWALRPKRHDTTWTENARLWGAIVGDPSILKSPVIYAATSPIVSLELAARADHRARMMQWALEEAAAKEAKRPAPPKPRRDRYMIENATVEALSEVLRDDEEAHFRVPSRKVLSRQDEMSEFIGSFDQYRPGGRGGSDRGAYLRLYNGGPFNVDRVGRGAFAVPDWSACFLGGIQPGPIQQIARHAADDGLLQRFMYCVPARQGHGEDRPPDQASLSRYAALVPALLALLPATLQNDQTKSVVLHADAHVPREDIDALARALAAMPDTSLRLKAAYGKWPGLFARLCLTFHMIEIADLAAQNKAAPPSFVGVVPASIARMVADYMREILLPHLLRAEAVMFSTGQTGHARWIAGHILSRNLTQIETRDVIRAYKALRAPEDKRELMAVMDGLTNLGWLEPVEPTNVAKGVSRWRVNPIVHVVFAERCAAEVRQRQQVRGDIEAAVAKHRRAG